MARERGQKKSFEQSLEDIKERMKEKRNKRLASASAANRGRSKIINKLSEGNVRRVILKGVQLNNKALAVALQGEREKVRQAHRAILQLKREQQALFLHLLLLKKRLKEQEALAAATRRGPEQICAGPSEPSSSASRRVSNLTSLDEPLRCVEQVLSTEPQDTEGAGRAEVDGQMALPRTVGVRRRRAEGGRRSERVRERRSFSEENRAAPLEVPDQDRPAAPAGSPVLGHGRNQNHPQEPAAETDDPMGSEEFEHSTPEPPPPPKPANQQQPRRRQAQAPRPKPDPAARKPDRGRRADRAPLKKPWENSKSRARSKSCERSAAPPRAGAPAAQGDKLNTSLGFNDTFDFDCEEAVHLTPFRAKPEDGQQATPTQEVAAAEKGRGQKQAPPRSSPETNSSSSEPEDSPYVPQRSRRRWSPPERPTPPPPRRGRPPRAGREKENLPPTPGNPPVSNRMEQSSPTPIAPEKEPHPPQSPGCDFVDSPGPMAEQETETRPEPQTQEEEETLLPVTPGVEAEMVRIDNVLSTFGDAPCPSPGLPSHTPQKSHAPPTVRVCRRGGRGVRAGRGFSLTDITNMSPAAYRKFPSAGSRPSDRGSTPVPARKRRCSMAVDYKEPSLHAKLRRGDKFTDTKFLRSPIFKQKPRSSMRSQPLERYKEPFLGCLQPSHPQ